MPDKNNMEKTEEEIKTEIEDLKKDIEKIKEEMREDCYVDSEDAQASNDELGWDLGKLMKAEAKLEGFQLGQKSKEEELKDLQKQFEHLYKLKSQNELLNYDKIIQILDKLSKKYGVGVGEDG